MERLVVHPPSIPVDGILVRVNLGLQPRENPMTRRKIRDQREFPLACPPVDSRLPDDSSSIRYDALLLSMQPVPHIEDCVA